MNWKIVVLACLLSSWNVFAMGSKPGGIDCSSGLSTQKTSQLLNQFVPRGSNGRSSSGAFFEIGTSGQVTKTVFLKNEHVAQAVASTQKVMTAYTAYHLGGLNNRVVWNSADQSYDSQGGRAVLHSTGLSPSLGQSIVAHDLLKTLMLQSSNGAALALSRSSTEQSTRAFVNAMNEFSEDLIGDETQFKTYFQNPAGLTDYNEDYAFADDPRRTQLSSADNMARLVGKIMQDGAFKSEMQRRGLIQFAPGYQMTKLGYTQAAGRTIVGYIPFPKCKNQGLSFAMFGDSSSDQFKRMYDMIQQLRIGMGY